MYLQNLIQNLAASSMLFRVSEICEANHYYLAASLMLFRVSEICEANHYYLAASSMLFRVSEICEANLMNHLIYPTLN